VGPGVGGEGLGRGSVGPGEGSGSWFVSTQPELGFWRTSTDKTTSSIIPCFMISSSPTARLRLSHDGNHAVQVDLTILFKHVEVACSILLAVPPTPPRFAHIHPIEKQAGLPYLLPGVV